MHQISKDLWQSSRYSSGMLNSHAYLLTRDSGNILFYNTADNDDLEHIHRLGGIQYQLLTHRDESGASLRRIRERFQSKLGCSQAETPYIGKDSDIDLVFDSTDLHLEDIQILHTPGHTDGSISFFYQSPHGQNYLFTGDTFFQWDGKWRTFVMKNAGGSREDMVSSLKKLGSLDPDLVMSSGFVGEVAYREVTSGSWRSALEQEIQKLEKTL